MAIAFRASSGSTSDSAAIPTGTTTGDVMIAVAAREGDNTVPTLPSGWNTVGSLGNNNCSILTAWRAFQSGDTAPTWTNATTVAIASYSGCDTTDPIGAGGTPNIGTDNTVEIPSLLLQVTDGSSWLVAGCFHRKTNTLTPGTGLTERQDINDAQPNLGLYDSGAGISSWSAVTITATDSDNWKESSFELLAAAGGNNFTETPIDSVGITETIAKSVGQTKTDSVGITDTTTVASVYNRTVADDVGLTDSTVIEKGKLETHTDNVGLTDLVTLELIYARFFTDDLGLTDTSEQDSGSSGTDFIESISDSVGITDLLTILQESEFGTLQDRVFTNLGYLGYTGTLHDRQFNYIKDKYEEDFGTAPPYFTMSDMLRALGFVADDLLNLPLGQYS